MYKRLGVNANARHHVYKGLFSTNLSQELIDKIQQASTFSMPLGDDKFKQQIEQALKRKFGRAKRGRPLKLNK